MTNEEVREVLQEQIDKYGQEYDDRGIEALKTAIKILEQTRWAPVSERLPEEENKEESQTTYDSGYNCGYADAM